MSATLSILISTLDDRITSVPNLLLPPNEQVCYIVVWQQTKKVSVEAQKALFLLERQDVEVISTTEKGLSKSRQQALNLSQTPLVLLADDDVVYQKDAFSRIINAFKERPECDVLCFMATDHDSNPLKSYPDKEIDYAKRPRGYAASSIEIAIRKRYDTPAFDSRFGLNSEELVCGEEDVFLHDCLTRKHHVRFVPETICATNKETTSTRLARHPKFIKTKGAALRYIHGRCGAWMRSVKYALQAPWGEKMWRFKLLAEGIRYIEKSKLPNQPVSVIIPYYNRESTLPRLFQSLLEIDYKPLEIIFVDNGSDDGSLKLCEAFRDKYASRFSRVAVLSEPERGAAAARNRGFMCASGTYVYFFDSDDEISPAFFKEAAPFMGYYDMICARTRMLFEDGSTKVRWRKVPTTLADQILGGVVSTQTCLLRRSFLASHPNSLDWNKSLTRWDDLEWGLRLLLAQPLVKWLNASHHRIYRHSDSLSGPSLKEDKQAVFATLSAMHHALLDFGGNCSPKELQKAHNALYARFLCAERRMKRNATELELSAEESALVRNLSDYASKRFLRISRIVNSLWPNWMPGLWRMYLFFA